MTSQSAIWAKKADLLQKFLALTNRISEILDDKDIGEQFSEMETLIRERADIIGEVSKIDTSAAVSPPGSFEEEEKQKWLCGELLNQIQAVEEKNERTMSLIMNGYKEQMRSNRQSRDTIGAYSRQMQDTVEEGALFNKMK